jgi:hypothetical protein
MNEITGRCLCGQVSFNYIGDLGPSAYCHCDDCRRCTGSAFNVSIRLERENLGINGEDNMGNITYVADSGKNISRLFCKSCGSPIMTLHQEQPEYAWVKAGIVDQHELIKPIGEIWTSRKVQWAQINVEQSFPENPT